MSVDIIDRAKVRADLRRHGLTIRAAAELGGMPAETLSRFLGGRVPDLNTLVRLHMALELASPPKQPRPRPAAGRVKRARLAEHFDVERELVP